MKFTLCLLVLCCVAFIVFNSIFFVHKKSAETCAQLKAIRNCKIRKQSSMRLILKWSNQCTSHCYFCVSNCFDYYHTQCYHKIFFSSQKNFSTCKSNYKKKQEKFFSAKKLSVMVCNVFFVHGLIMMLTWTRIAVIRTLIDNPFQSLDQIQIEASYENSVCFFFLS